MQKRRCRAAAGRFVMRVDSSNPARKIPLALKLAYSCFVAWHLLLNLRFYGPMNYLWFCDIAVLTTCIALWTRSRLLLSMSAVSLFGPAGLWIIDGAWKLLTHHALLGYTDYMEDVKYPLALRLASAFHLWLPFMLLYCFYRVGYDRRALLWQTLFAIVVLILSRMISAPPRVHTAHEVVNVNCAYGMSDVAAQTKLPPALYLCKLMVKCWIGMYLPTHLLLSWMFSLHRQRSLNATIAASTPQRCGQP
jgi:hypothetical protein